MGDDDHFIRPDNDSDEVVGHKTFWDAENRCFTHEPLHASEAEVIWAACKAAREKRAVDMPTVKDALNTLGQAYERLRELGWRDAIYCPKDGSAFEAIEAGSTGIHECHYSGEWPDGHWWISDGGDLWPSRPILFRPRAERDVGREIEVRRRCRRQPE